MLEKFMVENFYFQKIHVRNISCRVPQKKLLKKCAQVQLVNKKAYHIIFPNYINIYDHTSFLHASI